MNQGVDILCVLITAFGMGIVFLLLCANQALGRIQKAIEDQMEFMIHDSVDHRCHDDLEDDEDEDEEDDDDGDSWRKKKHAP